MLEPAEQLSALGMINLGKIHWNLLPSELIQITINKNQGQFTDTGSLACSTGTFTGRSPKDKYVVKDENTKDVVWWGDVNHPFESNQFSKLYNRILAYLENKEVFVKDVYACAEKEHRLNVRVVTESAWQSLFSHNLFRNPTQEEANSFNPEWSIIAVPNFKAIPEIDGTRQENFTIIDFTKKRVIIGGSAYTGEIKKSIFTVLNYLLPHKKDVLSMHCSANVGKNDESALFFWLSGTGKTTLSADPERRLIGDDEHGWGDKGVFNFEGGCYAKCVNLSKEKEPQIYDAIRFGSLLENTKFYEGTRTVDFEDVTVTENTRVAYSLEFIDNIVPSSTGSHPKNIFFLTCDAFGVLPPISKLSKEQAMYHFISGYTAKVAGTEEGITEPQVTFSACFGEPFLPLAPKYYAEMLGKKMEEHDVNIWLINTGWTGGGYGVGERINLKYTRAMITAVLNNSFEDVTFQTEPFFGLTIPTSCPEVPSEILDPASVWDNADDYEKVATNLSDQFVKNYEQYENEENGNIIAGAPVKQVSNLI
ncbi:phosphoenolpyruvate carboxykinase (ATP) [Crocinitomix catalasitica]|uniref:phosphoenolpyruvate carboxykinase (ATP) n=1 Tax=Crocinitomix catalasitica TaxID=184607 RepID=UPI0004819C4E|nr:phosphoenolpyruvate carboxykinase (ATP) [Crocinitomix catalasitica]